MTFDTSQLHKISLKKPIGVLGFKYIKWSYAGKFGAIFASIPAPIVAALYCLFFAYVGKCNDSENKHIFIVSFYKSMFFGKKIKLMSCYVCAGAGGLSYLQFCNLNSFRTKFILGFSFFMGLSVPQYFNEYEAINGYGPVHTSARWVWRNKHSFLNPS